MSCIVNWCFANDSRQQPRTHPSRPLSTSRTLPIVIQTHPFPSSSITGRLVKQPYPPIKKRKTKSVSRLGPCSATSHSTNHPCGTRCCPTTHSRSSPYPFVRPSHFTAPTRSTSPTHSPFDDQPRPGHSQHDICFVGRKSPPTSFHHPFPPGPLPSFLIHDDQFRRPTTHLAHPIPSLPYQRTHRT